MSPEEVKLGLTEMQFRDQLLVFLEGSLGVRRGELGALRWMDCDFFNGVFHTDVEGPLILAKSDDATMALP